MGAETKLGSNLDLAHGAIKRCHLLGPLGQLALSRLAATLPQSRLSVILPGFGDHIVNGVRRHLELIRDLRYWLPIVHPLDNIRSVLLEFAVVVGAPAFGHGPRLVVRSSVVSLVLPAVKHPLATGMPPLVSSPHG